MTADRPGPLMVFAKPTGGRFGAAPPRHDHAELIIASTQGEP